MRLTEKRALNVKFLFISFLLQILLQTFYVPIRNLACFIEGMVETACRSSCVVLVVVAAVGAAASVVVVVLVVGVVMCRSRRLRRRRRPIVSKVGMLRQILV